mmetsp:Transcript_10242/g.30822  ORF Transcript_10242/g.30822 Transcript_10242/m.30822 type:complete len:207 (-) Transcript_10242:543-1163(-)
MTSSWQHFLFCLTTSFVSRVHPSTSVSCTSQSRYLSPSRRKAHSHQPGWLSMSSGAASQRTSPSTESEITALVLYLFSTSMMCSAKGPICSIHAFFRLMLCSPADQTSPRRKRDRTSCPTSEVTRSRSLETWSSILGFTRWAPCPSLAGGGVGLTNRCVISLSSSTESTECNGSSCGTLRTRVRRGMARGFFIPSASRMHSSLTAG